MEKKYSVLVVEDEAPLGDSLEEKLLEEGFDVIRASNGEEGYKLALERHPDLILSDLIMPKIDGLTMLKMLRKDEWGSQAAVIILTNISDESKVAEVLSSSLSNINNTYEYLVKTDWSLDAVVDKIKQRLQIDKK
ncbi:MAG: response regulator [Candidatus Paceibacterota bacterium]|jgi:two-component system alkaline phosphatase synthesis response regulator PhoP